MKPLHFALLAILPAGSLSAAVIADFESQSPGDLFTTDVPGWTQSSPNPVFGGNPVPLARIETAPGFNGGAGSLVGAIGTTEGNNPLSATTSVGTNFSPFSVLDSQLSLNLAIVDDPTDAWAVRDQFGIDISAEGGGSLVSLVFTPNDVSDTAWDISYTVGGGTAVQTGESILSLGEYVFTMNFQPGTFELAYQSAGGGAQVTSSTAATYAPTDTLSRIDLVHTQLDFGSPGDSYNALLFDNVAVVPEPSVAMLAALASLSLLRRRRVA